MGVQQLKQWQPGQVHAPFTVVNACPCDILCQLETEMRPCFRRQGCVREPTVLTAEVQSSGAKTNVGQGAGTVVSLFWGWQPPVMG